MPLAALGGLGISSLIGAGTSLAGAAIGSSSAKKAAAAQQQAAQQAAQYTQGASNNALNFENGIWNQAQQNYAPYQQIGGGALGQLGYLLGISPSGSVGNFTSPAQGLPSPGSNSSPSAAMPVTSLNQLNGGVSSLSAPGGSSLSSSGSPSMPIGAPRAGVAGATGNINSATPSIGGQAPQGAQGGFGSLLTPYSGHFEAPTALTEQNDPGYQARLNLGTDALQRSAAARGGLLTGGTAKALDTYAQDYASNEYGNVYNRALQGFQTNYNQYNNDQNNVFNRLMGLTGVGQNATNSLTSAGLSAGNNVTSNLLGSAGQIGNYITNAGAANASGIYNSGAAWGGALGSIGNNLSGLAQLNYMNSGGGGGNPYQTLYNAQNQNLGGLYQSPTLNYGIEG